MLAQGVGECVRLRFRNRDRFRDRDLVPVLDRDRNRERFGDRVRFRDGGRVRAFVPLAVSRAAGTFHRDCGVLLDGDSVVQNAIFKATKR